MSSRHLVHPELQTWIAQYATVDLDADRVILLRATRPVDERAASDDLSVEERYVGPPGAAVRVLVFTPRGVAAPMPAVMHIHGGGYVMGKPEECLNENAELALRCGCMVVSVDYRLSPETPYPGGLDDCHAVLEWLHASAASLGVDRDRIALKGESAGGGLAACLAQKARDEKKYPICSQVLIAPMLDDRTPAAANPFSGEFVWTENSNRFAWQAYLAERYGADTLPPYASAARAKDLSGLPPLFLAVGALDLFFDQNLEYAQRLNRAGVSSELHVYPGAFHSFNRVGGSSLAQRLRGDYTRALIEAFGGSGAGIGANR
ncbi:alpha/beta hydrolase [Achromobacter spanius]|uniref:alpha/beta hydrolase n=1 Tax=Achromobacter spanius TaxID=217203 RepID=UPI00320ACD83